MNNASDELMKHVGTRVIKCARITSDDRWNRPDTVIALPVGHSDEELMMFFSQLNFKYDNGYGGQNLFGYVWYTDGTWSARGEYDGSEWWDHHECPPIPEELAQTFDNSQDLLLE